VEELFGLVRLNATARRVRSDASLESGRLQSMWISYLALLLAVQSAPFEVGRPVPALTLPSIEDGTPLSVADFRGQKVMLHVWASW